MLKGDLAIEQSKALIRLFKSMKDYIIENQQLMITQKDYVALAQKVESNTDDIREINNTLDTVATKADLSDFMKLFDYGIEHDEILILDGEPFKADLVYQKIYRRAKRKVLLIDDYNTKDMKEYHCGASSKDAGKKITSIMQVNDISNYRDMVKELLANPPLVLR